MSTGASLAIGIDIGGTKIAAGLTDEAGNILEQTSIPTPAADPDALLSAVTGLIASWADRQPVAAGVAAAGFVSADQSVVYYAPNINWRNEPLARRIEEAVGLEVVIENDANAAGWAEYRFGAGRGYSSMVMLTLGTGVGGAIVSNGQIARGGFGAGAELGHLRVVPDGLPCGCGQRGCLEQYASGTALMALAHARADAGGIGAGLAAARRRDGGLSAANLSALIEANDPGALEALTEVARQAGAACASLSAVLDPEIFVIGGGLSAAGERLLGPLRDSFADHQPAAGFHPAPRFALAETRNNAGIVGVADLARAHARRGVRPELG